MRRIPLCALIIILSCTLGAIGCDSGNGGGGGPDAVVPDDVLPDGPGEDVLGEDLATEDSVAADTLPGDVPVDTLPDELPPPDCFEDADCDDEDLCNGVEVCLDKVCIPGAPVDCGAPGPCHESVECIPDTGQCVVTAFPAGTDCDDGLICNGLSVCDGAGLCIPGGDAPVCAGAETCQEPDGGCACIAPNWIEDDACIGPARTATFDDVALGEDGKWVGADLYGAIRSGNAVLVNEYDPEYFSWGGFAISNHADTETPGWGNDLSAIPGGGVHGSAAFAVGYDSGFTALPPTLEILDAGNGGVVLKGVYVTNTTYGYLSMLEGDDYAKKFGGETGADEDWFLLTVTGIGPGGAETGTVDLYLADFRAGDPAEDYILDQWTWLDLTPLGPVTSLRFSLASTDMGDWGMNTPAYFALDDLNRLEPVAAFHDLGLGAEEARDGADGGGAFQSGNLRFLNNYNAEYLTWDGFAVSTMTDATTPGWGNMFSAIPGSGEDDAAYAIAYDGADFGNPLPTIEVVGPPAVFASMSVTNTTYTYLSMLEGDDFAKQFGGVTGTDEDWYLLTVEGLDASGAVIGAVEQYLADLRFEGASEDDYLLSTWAPVDLTPLGAVAALRLDLSSSDMGEWGMNTPGYVAVDMVALQP
jgi:hypothetical protein